MNRALYARRRAANGVAMVLAWGAALSGLVILALILWALVWKGVHGLSFAVFTQTTPSPGADSGGLINAIVGSLAMTVLGTLIGTPLGILAGTFLAEYGPQSKLALVVRFVNDTLLSAPSIVIGLFVYQIMVAPMHHFSGWAGGVALSLLVLPVVVRTTEDMLLLVPTALREAAAALGSPRWVVVTQVSYRAARAGLITGALLAVARIAGETAPLLFTALNSPSTSSSLNEPMANLPVVIFQFAQSPYANWQQLAWTGALLVTFAVLALNIGARTLSSSSNR